MTDLDDAAWRRGLAVALVVGAALRLSLLLHPYPGVEFQSHFPRNAVQSFVEGTWQPYGLHHGGGIVIALRAAYSVWYAIGHALGAYQERADLLAAYLLDPFPLQLVGRALVATASLATVVLVAVLGRTLGWRVAGVLGALFVAVSPSHVRESHRIWVDVPAGALALGAVLAAVRAVQERHLATLALAGALGGVTIAFRHSSFAIALPVALAAVLGGPAALRPLATRLALTGGLAVAAFALCSPYAFLQWRETMAVLTTQSSITFSPLGRGLRLPALLWICIGPALLALALVGLAALARRRPRETAVVAAFPLAYAAILAPSTMLYARYVALLVPFVGLFAGAGAAVVGAALVRRAPLAAATAVAVVLALEPAWQSAGWVRLLGREDTAVAAGRWIRTHVPPGSTLLLPNAIVYPNPVLPISRAMVQLLYPAHAPALLARGVGAQDLAYVERYEKMFGVVIRHDTLPRWVVTASHPTILDELHTPPDLVARLRAMGARPAAAFVGAPDPVPAGVVYDPIDADYLPLRGAWRLAHPGPNLVVWEVPAS